MLAWGGPQQTTEELRAAQEENRFLQEELANVQEDASKRYRDAEAKVNELQGQYMSVSDKLEAATQGGRSRAGATQDTRELRAEIDRTSQLAWVRGCDVVAHLDGPPTQA